MIEYSRICNLKFHFYFNKISICPCHDSVRRWYVPLSDFVLPLQSAGTIMYASKVIRNSMFIPMIMNHKFEIVNVYGRFAMVRISLAN